MKWESLIAVFLLLSCNNSHSVNLKENTLFPLIFSPDGIFNLKEDGISLKLKKIEGVAYLAEWGKENLFKDSIQLFPDGNAQGYFVNDIGIYIIQGCGTGCSVVNIFLNEGSKSLYFENPLLISMKDSLIVYKGETEDSIVIIENLINNKRQKIGTTFLPQSYPGLIVDSIAVQSNKTLFLKWQDSDGHSVKSLLKYDY